MATDHLKPHQFQPGQSGNINGRPKNVLTKAEFKKIVDELSFLTVKELREYSEREDQTAIRIQIAQTLVASIEERDHSKIETLMNRSIGKVEDKLSITKLSNEELAAEAQRRLEEADGPNTSATDLIALRGQI